MADDESGSSQTTGAPSEQRLPASERKWRSWLTPWSTRLRGATRALRHRNFRLFLGGQFLSLIGTWVQTVALNWLVYRLTGSAVMLGLIGFASQIPYLFSPIGGVVADRISRHRMIILTQALSTIQAVLLGWLTLTGQVRIWHIFFLALALGVIGMFDMTGRQSFLVEMVGKEDLVNAIALNSSVYNSGRIVGPAVAGVLVAAIGEGWCFLLNASSFLAVIVGLLLMRLPPPAARTHGISPVEQLREGINYVRRHDPSRALLINLGIVSIMSYSFIVLMPVFADRMLGGGPKTLGVLMSAFGAGALLGAMYMASLTGLRGLSRTIVRATIVYSIALILFAFSPSIALASFFLIVTGFGMMLQVASTNTGLQSITPDALRGRVMGFYGMMFMGMVPIGSLVAGWLGEWIGASYTVSLGAAVSIVAALVFNRQRPVVVAALRQIMEQHVALVPVPTDIPRTNGNAR
ncbi:MAG: MFS transporter [Acidobacteria bacterium]|nr:MFS transporter [Acidobacteriota bacterium]